MIVIEGVDFFCFLPIVVIIFALVSQIELSFCCYTGLALITMKEALLWTDGRYFLQAEQQLTNRWKLMRMGEDPPVEVWIADVSVHICS
jgi:hypothetical protein